MSRNDDHPLLALITGPMFAGKSTELCSRFQKCLGKSIIIAPTMSKDHDAGAICPREQMQRHRATFVDGLSLTYAQQLIADLYTHVFIDEAQFFCNGDELSAFCRVLVDSEVHVCIAALNLDHKRRPWPAIALVESRLSPSIELLHARCAATLCSQPAVYSAKIASDQSGDAIIDILAEYRPLCRSCYAKNRNFSKELAKRKC